MENEAKIALMFDLAEKQQHALSDLVKELNNTSKTLRNDAREIFDAQARQGYLELSRNAKNALERPASEFEERISYLLKKSEEVNRHIDIVSDRLSLKLTGFIAAACATCLLVMFGSYLWLGSDIRSLRAEQLSLKDNLKALENAGGKVILGNCDGQVCVRVDPNKQPYTHTATGLPMYFVK